MKKPSSAKKNSPLLFRLVAGTMIAVGFSFVAFIIFIIGGLLFLTLPGIVDQGPGFHFQSNCPVYATTGCYTELHYTGILLKNRPPTVAQGLTQVIKGRKDKTQPQDPYQYTCMVEEMFSRDENGKQIPNNPPIIRVVTDLNEKMQLHDEPLVNGDVSWQDQYYCWGK